MQREFQGDIRSSEWIRYGAGMMESTASTSSLLLLLLLFVLFDSFAKALKIPYPILLVVAGIGLSVMPHMPRFAAGATATICVLPIA